MGDQERSKGKSKVNGNYALWAPEESNELLQLMVDAIKNGWRDSSGGLSKLTVEKRILPALNEKLGCQRSYAQYQSRLKWFKHRFNNFSELMRHNSGFGWDPITKRFTASDEVWEDYFKSHPTHKNLRTDTIADYDDLAFVFGSSTAVGKNSIGLGDETDARIYSVEEDNQCRIDQLHFDFANDGFTQNDIQVDSQDPRLSQYTSSAPQEINVEATSTKYYKRKRNRTEYEGNSSSTEETNRSNVLDKLSNTLDSIAADIHILVQKRVKESGCWDAIKELPDLDSDTCFKVLEWLNTKSKKDTFINMSPQDRYKWIMFKLSK
ncbi:PREDICTED: uncharacterized protein At2g29880-like [Ipomoea nil]|uniref:uncharacterized protein At2g29880-like n=1 Tax=Ipomoea nil TaxID=35883 RepID=UPI000900F733|nr:PREDICTED: uncharacterized protein At2g29880-like [Ipomoea nil]